MMNINIIIQGNPITKKNHSQIIRNKKTGKTMLIPSKQYNNYLPVFVKECMAQHVYQKHINTPINIKCLYYMKTKRKVDLTNLLSATCDLLMSAGVIEDDNCTIVISHDGSRVFYDKDNPRVEIEITDTQNTFPN